jgi:hypothetical protein
MLKGIFGPERERERERESERESERARGGTKELQNEEVHNLYFSPNDQHNKTNKSTVSGIWSNCGVCRNSVNILVAIHN